MFTSGPNTYHQLNADSNNKSADRFECPCVCPAQPVDVDIDSISVYSIGADHSVYLTKDGRAFGSGFDEYFRIGLPYRRNYKHSVEITFPGVGYNFVDVHCGTMYTLYLFECGLLVYCHEKCKNRVPAYHVLDQKPVYITGSVNYAIAIDSDGDLYMFSDQNPYQKPAKHTFDEPIFDCCAGINFVAVVTVSGKVYGNGVLNNGQNDFAEVASLIGLKITSIKADHYHCLALTDDGVVYAFGDNGWGQLGNGTLVNSPFFFEVELLKPNKIAFIDVGHSHSIFGTTDGELYSCGYNGFGQLMQATLGDQKNTVPTRCAISEKVTYACCGTWATAVFVDHPDPVHKGYQYFIANAVDNKPMTGKEKDKLIDQLRGENKILKEQSEKAHEKINDMKETLEKTQEEISFLKDHPDIMEEILHATQDRMNASKLSNEQELDEYGDIITRSINLDNDTDKSEGSVNGEKIGKKHDKTSDNQEITEADDPILNFGELGRLAIKQTRELINDVKRVREQASSTKESDLL